MRRAQAGLVLLGLVGCADHVHLYPRTGQAKAAAFARQARQATRPAPAGLDGRDAAIVMDNYRRASLPASAAGSGASPFGDALPGPSGRRPEEGP